MTFLIPRIISYNSATQLQGARGWVATLSYMRRSVCNVELRITYFEAEVLRKRITPRLGLPWLIGNRVRVLRAIGTGLMGWKGMMRFKKTHTQCCIAFMTHGSGGGLVLIKMP